jgi:hypothetical protein
LRYNERLAAGAATLGGVSLADREKLTALGGDILRRRAEQVAKVLKDRPAR